MAIEPVPIIEELRQMFQGYLEKAQVERTGHVEMKNAASICYWNGIINSLQRCLISLDSVQQKHEAAPTPAMDVEGLARKLADIAFRCIKNVQGTWGADNAQSYFEDELTSWLIPHDAALTAKVRGEADSLREHLHWALLHANPACVNHGTADKSFRWYCSHCHAGCSMMGKGEHKPECPYAAAVAAEERGKLP